MEDEDGVEGGELGAGAAEGEADDYRVEDDAKFKLWMLVSMVVTVGFGARERGWGLTTRKAAI